MEGGKMRYIAGIAIVGAIAGWVYLQFTGCNHPLCRIIGVYTYNVTTLGEYREYVAGKDLNSIHRASHLSFNCELYRDQFIEVFDKFMKKEINNELMFKVIPPGNVDEIHQQLGARREGAILHLMNDVTVRQEGIDDWVQQFSTTINSKPEKKDEYSFILLVRRLFNEVVFHADGAQRSIKIEDRFKCP